MPIKFLELKKIQLYLLVPFLLVTIFTVYKYSEINPEKFQTESFLLEQSSSSDKFIERVKYKNPSLLSVGYPSEIHHILAVSKGKVLVLTNLGPGIIDLKTQKWVKLAGQPSSEKFWWGGGVWQDNTVTLHLDKASGRKNHGMDVGEGYQTWKFNLETGAITKTSYKEFAPTPTPDPIISDNPKLAANLEVINIPKSYYETYINQNYTRAGKFIFTHISQVLPLSEKKPLDVYYWEDGKEVALRLGLYIYDTETGIGKFYSDEMLGHAGQIFVDNNLVYIEHNSEGVTIFNLEKASGVINSYSQKI